VEIVRRVAVYVVLCVVLGIAIMSTGSVPVISNEVVRALILLPLGGWVVTAIGRRLTGWPARKPETYFPLPIEGDGGSWNVTLYDPRPEPGPVAEYLSKEHGATWFDTFGSVAHDSLPLLIAKSMTEDSAVTMADDLRGLGASVGVQDKRN